MQKITSAVWLEALETLLEPPALSARNLIEV